MKRRSRRLEVALPTSILSVEPDLLTKTIKVGIVARYLAMFRVDGLNLYMDPHSSAKDLELMKTLLKYILTAPYLRKHVFHISPSLRYAGLLPPLQIPTHGVGGPKQGEVREALVIRRKRNCLVLEAGLSEPVEVCPERLSRCYEKGELVYIRITKLEPLEAEIVEEPDVYTGFEVKSFTTLRSVLQHFRAKGFLIIATSRRGKDVREVLKDLPSMISSKSGTLLVFGSPREGLYEIAEAEGFDLDSLADLVLNTIPGQGVITVRTEEALAATLALMNLFVPD